MLYAAASDMASNFEQMSLITPVWGPGNGLPSTLATWQPPEYNPADQPDRYQPQSSLTSFYVPPKKSHAGRWIALVLVLALAGGGVGYKWMKDRQKIHTTLRAGSGVAPGDPTVPPDGPGNVYTSRAGHFAVRFPAGDKIQTDSRSGGDSTLRFTMNGAGDNVANVAVLEADMSENVSADRARAALTLVASGFSPGTSMKFKAWRGRPAMEGTATDNGETAHALIVLYGGSRVYFIVAGDDASFDDLQKSFVALP